MCNPLPFRFDHGLWVGSVGAVETLCERRALRSFPQAAALPTPHATARLPGSSSGIADGGGPPASATLQHGPPQRLGGDQPGGEPRSPPTEHHWRRSSATSSNPTPEPSRQESKARPPHAHQQPPAAAPTNSRGHSPTRPPSDGHRTVPPRPTAHGSVLSMLSPPTRRQPPHHPQQQPHETLCEGSIPITPDILHLLDTGAGVRVEGTPDKDPACQRLFRATPPN